MFSSISVNICDGEGRRKLGRVLKQSDDSIQHWTDRAAERLGQKLVEVVNAYHGGTSAGETQVAREAEYRVSGLAVIKDLVPALAVLVSFLALLVSATVQLRTIRTSRDVQLASLEAQWVRNQVEGPAH